MYRNLHNRVEVIAPVDNQTIKEKLYQILKAHIDDKSQVWEMHRHRGISRPDLVVITVCRPDAALLRREQDQAASGSIRAERERGRGLSGKFTGERQELIHRQYFEVRRFLEEKNVPVLLLDTEKMSVGQEADAVLRLL